MAFHWAIFSGKVELVEVDHGNTYRITGDWWITKESMATMNDEWFILDELAVPDHIKAKAKKWMAENGLEAK